MINTVVAGKANAPAVKPRRKVIAARDITWTNNKVLWKQGDEITDSAVAQQLLQYAKELVKEVDADKPEEVKKRK